MMTICNIVVLLRSSAKLHALKSAHVCWGKVVYIVHSVGLYTQLMLYANMALACWSWGLIYK